MINAVESPYPRSSATRNWWRKTLILMPVVLQIFRGSVLSLMQRLLIRRRRCAGWRFLRNVMRCRYLNSQCATGRV